MRLLSFALFILFMSGCNSKLTGYNLKASVGNTEYDNGQRAFYTGASVDAHFDVK